MMKELLECLLSHTDDWNRGEPRKPDISPQLHTHRKLSITWRAITVTGTTKPEKYVVKNMGPCELITLTGKDANSWKNSYFWRTLGYYKNGHHQLLSHTRYMRIYGTISYLIYHPKLKERCQARILPCDSCQRTKLPGRGYSHLPPRDANNMPW